MVVLSSSQPHQSKKRTLKKSLMMAVLMELSLKTTGGGMVIEEARNYNEASQFSNSKSYGHKSAQNKHQSVTNSADDFEDSAAAKSFKQHIQESKKPDDEDSDDEYNDDEFETSANQGLASISQSGKLPPLASGMQTTNKSFTLTNDGNSSFINKL
eukprot:CAMPEP_0176346186 /NCGR_PEP_ID=MMETSP0126-20121128/6043_1 /TAXON_ID=141414 ORGANISM="Strombidinopsis acuminatum, Strain SPMC142" /NCGR_SAMPLE_ID=MMETSP0126 /ASSEMBLY_ACC=CAM_ASM_000229 /LENGTH=155 /DNA_ID=CAMNT_0017693585 /DNA_START=700 /DNA_END=1166 /DNA_ORIENTATION=+